jgi:hypothetical protein
MDGRGKYLRKTRQKERGPWLRVSRFARTRASSWRTGLFADDGGAIGQVG